MSSKTVALLLVMSGALVAAPAWAQSTTHSGHAAHATEATPAIPAQRWATDAPLRAGMRQVSASVNILALDRAGRLDAGRRTAAAAQIDAAIKDMIANCKLEPDADAALHGLLAKFMIGADAARKGPLSAAGLTSMQEALARYPQMFNDPDWAARK